MKKNQLLRFVTSYFLTLILIFSSLVQIAFAKNPVFGNKDKEKTSTTKNFDEEPVENSYFVQQDTVHAATKKFIDGMKGSNKEVTEIIVDVLAESDDKVKFVGIGSHATNKNFKDPLSGGTSDFDYRLVFDGNRDEAIQRYKAMQGKIRQKVVEKFKNDPQKAKKILAKMNLYPPEQVIGHIDDPQKAINELNRLKINPSLAVDDGLKPVVNQIDLATFDGLAGKGGKAFRDMYEADKGRTFWKTGKQVFSGFGDLTPLGEVRGIYTIEGSANMADQFGNFVRNNLKERDYRAAVKNLKRLQQTMEKGRNLSRLSKKDYVDDLVKWLDECCADDALKLADTMNQPGFQERLATAFKQIEFDSAMLKEFARRGDPRAISIIRELLEQGAIQSSGKWAKTKQALMQLADEFRRLNSYVPWENIFKGLVVVLFAYQAYDINKKAEAEDWEGAFREAAFGSATEIAVIVGGLSLMLPVVFIQVLVSVFIDETKSSSYAFVASYQECRDLLAGIYSVKGRENILEEQKLETNIEQMARDYTEQEEVLKVVKEHADNASKRGDKLEPRIAEQLYQRCGNEILQRWSNRRLEIIGEAITHLKNFEAQFNGSMFTGSSSPEEIWLLPENDAKVDLQADFVGNLAEMQQSLIDFENTIKSIGGKNKAVGVSINHYYKWIPLNLEEENLASSLDPFFSRERASKTFTFKEEGVKDLRLEYQIEIKVQSVADDVFGIVDAGYLNRTLSKSTPFNINVLSPKGKVEIVAPLKPAADSPINLKAKFDGNLQKMNPSFVWYDLTANSSPQTGDSYLFTLKENETKHVRLELFSKVNGEDVKIAQTEKTITLEGKDKKDDQTTAEAKASPKPSPDTSPEPSPGSSPKPSPDASPQPSPDASPEKGPKELSLSEMKFGGTSSNIWEYLDIDNTFNRGFRLRRQRAKSKGTGECKWEALLGAELWAKINPAFAPSTPQEITKKIDEFAVESKGWGKTTKTRNLSISGFKGQFSDTSVRFRGGGWSYDAGFRGDSVSAEGRGWIFVGDKAVEIGYNISGAGCWNNSDRAFLERQASAAQAEAIAIINGLSLGVGGFSQSAYDGPKLDGSDMPTLELVIDPNRKQLKKGEIVNVQAVVKNADASDGPIEFEWTGDHGGKGANVQFIAEKPGKHTLSVVAKGSQYQIGSASVEFEISNLKAEIKRLTPGAKFAVGVPVSFAAELLSEGKPASGNYIYRFEPSPGVEFDTNDSAKKQSTAKFTKPGRERIWVVVLEKKGNTLETIAESDQIEIEIVEPELKITFDQEKALIGKAVKAKVDVAPADLKDINFRWEISSNAKKALESPDSKELTFIPQDGEPITVKVSARVPFSGEDLGDKTATITAQSFNVSVNVLGPIGVKPQIWKEGVGLVTVDKGIAVFQNVGLRAVVTPQAENLRYRWTINEDSHFVGGSSSAEIRVNRSQPGTCEATVVVTDKDGIEVGRGSASFNVSISQDELSNASKFSDSAKKSAEANTIARKGEIDEAIKLAEEAAALNPKNTEAKTLADKLKRDKATINTQIEKTKQLISQSKFPEAQKELIEAKNANPYYKPTVELENELGDKWRKFDAGVQQGFGNIRLASENKDFKRSLELVEKLRTEYQLTPDNLRELSNYENFARIHETEKERQRKILAQGEAKFNEGDYDGAIKDFDVMFTNLNTYWNSNFNPEPKKYGDLKNEAVRRQKRITELVPNIKRTIEQNSNNEVLLKNALANVEELLGFQPDNEGFQNYRTSINDLLQRKGNLVKISSIIASGDSFYKDKKYTNAVKEYDNAIKIDPNNAEAFRKRAMANRENGNEKAALRDFNKSIELDPNNYQTHGGRGLVHRALKDYKEAMADFNRVIELNPKYANGYFYRGHLKLTQEEDYKGAIADFDSAIRLDPKHSAALINRGSAKSKLGDESGAIRDYNQAITVDPKNSLAHNNRGTIKEKQNDLKGAKADYEKAIELDPGNKLARSNLDKLNAKMSGSQTATTKPPVPTKTPSPTPTSGKAEVEIIDVTNIYSVANKPTVPTTFTVRSSYMVTLIETYHWNNSVGTTVPGTISLRHSNGTVYGPWKATGRAGQGGVKNAYWTVKPNVTIPAGTYTIVDSDPATWSQNAQSGGKGFATVKGYAVSSAAVPTAPTPERMRITTTYINASQQNVHIFATGENFSADNKLSPGGRRTASGEGPKFSNITVYAGVNGKIIHQISFNVSPDGNYTVTFDSNNRLTLGQTSAASKQPSKSSQNSLIYLSFINRSRSNIHVFAQSENFSSENLLKPGQVRNVVIKHSGRSKLQVMAFKPDGKYDQSVEFLVKENGSYTVTFGSNNKLSSTESIGLLTTPSISDLFSKTFISARRQIAEINQKGGSEVRKHDTSGVSHDFFQLF